MMDDFPRDHGNLEADHLDRLIDTTLAQMTAVEGTPLIRSSVLARIRARHRSVAAEAGWRPSLMRLGTVIAPAAAAAVVLSIWWHQGAPTPPNTPITIDRGIPTGETTPTQSPPPEIVTAPLEPPSRAADRTPVTPAVEPPRDPATTMARIEPLPAPPPIEFHMIVPDALEVQAIVIPELSIEEIEIQPLAPSRPGIEEP